MPAALRSPAVIDHLLGALHQQAGKADGVGPVLLVGADQASGGTLMPRLTTW